MRKTKYLFALLSITGVLALSPTVAQTAEKTDSSDEVEHTQATLNVIELAQGTPSQSTDSVEETVEETGTDTVESDESGNESDSSAPDPTQEDNPGATDPETTPTQPATPNSNQTQEGTSESPGSETVPSQPATSNPDQLKGDYSQLQTYLQQQNWRAADQATFDAMLQAAGTNSQSQGRFQLDEWREFSCTDLKEVDRLWSEASNGKLGFSIQKRILDAVQRNYIVFYTRIGWFDLLTNTWKVAWNYNQDMKKAEYSAEPLFDTPLQEFPEGYLPAKLEWETAGDEAPVDRRFERMDACSL